MKFFVKWMILAVAVIGLLMLMINMAITFPDYFWGSVGAGWGMAFAYVVSGFLIFYYAWNYTPKSFNKIFIISIAGRLVLVSIAVILVLKYASVSMLHFLISMFVFYFIFQIIEVVGFNKLINEGNSV